MREARLADVDWDRSKDGILRVFVSPKAYLHVDGKRMLDPKGKPRKSNRFAVALKAGSHEIAMVRDGFETITKHVTVEPGKPYALNFVIRPTNINLEEMVLIPAGVFKMGLSKNDFKWIKKKLGWNRNTSQIKKMHIRETPHHYKNLKAFYIDKYEVTNGQYKKFVDATNQKKLPRHWVNGTYPEGQADHPVTNVTWQQASDYAKWAGKRLPTEPEWEKAARWSITRSKPRKVPIKKFPNEKVVEKLLKKKFLIKNKKKPDYVYFIDKRIITAVPKKRISGAELYFWKENEFRKILKRLVKAEHMEPVLTLWRSARGKSLIFPWGDEYRKNIANVAEIKRDGPVISGTYSEGISFFGTIDMTGNVREWTASRYEAYPKSTYQDEFTDGQNTRVVRGGSYRDSMMESFSSCRIVTNQEVADDDLGFRCVKDVK